METRIITEFLGTINGAEIKTEQLFYTVEYIVEEIEANFNVVVEKAFVENIRDYVYNVWLDSGEIEYSEIEKEIYNVISSNAETLQEIKDYITLN